MSILTAILQIFERSGFRSEIGAAMHICPNASRVLIKWGFDFEAAKAVTVGQVDTAQTIFPVLMIARNML
jgi:salicylate hydroxylase